MSCKYLIVLTVTTCLEAWHYPRPVYPPPAPLWQDQYMKLRDRMPATLNVIPVNPIAEPQIVKRRPDEQIHPMEDHFEDVYPLPEEMYDFGNEDRIFAIRNVPYYHRERYRLRDQIIDEERRKYKNKVVKNQLESNSKKSNKESVAKETKESKTTSTSSSKTSENNEKSRNKNEADRDGKPIMKEPLPADPKLLPLEISSHAIPSPHGGVTVVTEMLYDPFKTTNIPLPPFMPPLPSSNVEFNGPNIIPQPTSPLSGYGSFVPTTGVFPTTNHKPIWNERQYLPTQIPTFKSSISSLRPFRKLRANSTKPFKSSKSSEQESNLGATAIAGIIIGSLVSVSLLAGTALFVMYKTQFGRAKPSEIPQPHPPAAISNSNYVDRVSVDVESDNHNPSRYFDVDTDEDFVSLDNDSFLLSLEASIYENEYAFSFYEEHNTKV